MTNQPCIDNKFKLLDLLSDGKIHSGEKIGKKLSISRSAVCKIVKSLNSRNIKVVSAQSLGYYLEDIFIKLDADIISKNITHPFFKDLIVKKFIVLTRPIIL